MSVIKVTIEIITDNPEETKKAVNKYLQESLENDFLQGDEEIASIQIEGDEE